MSTANTSNHLVYHSYCNSDLLYLKCRDFTNAYLFLIDTGASISTIKASVIRNPHAIDTQAPIKVNGLSGETSTLGTISFRSTVWNTRLRFVQTFHVLPDENTTLPCDGILGNDFLSYVNAEISYGNRNISLSLDG